MALLTIGGVGVAVTSKRMQALDQAPFRHLGVEPSEQKILALKSTCHFRAEFEPIAEKVIVVIAPGGYLADPARYPYRRGCAPASACARSARTSAAFPSPRFSRGEG